MPEARHPRQAGFGYRREFALTEAEWASETDPVTMLRHLGIDASPRKLRLFAVSCYRQVWSELSPRAREALEVAEQFADGQVSRHALAHQQMLVVQAGVERCATEEYALVAASNAVRDVPITLQFGFATTADGVQAAARGQALRPDTCTCLRDIFTPFRRSGELMISASSLALAEAAYDERLLPSGKLDPVWLAILADALEEAGCEDRDLIEHLRAAGPHVRGCFVVDLLLGKE